MKVSTEYIRDMYGVKRRKIKDTNIFVSKTHMGSWIAHGGVQQSLASMIELNGEYHFDTLKDLKTAFTKHLQSLPHKDVEPFLNNKQKDNRHERSARKGLHC